MIALNNDWEFTEQWSDAFMRGEDVAFASATSSIEGAATSADTTVAGEDAASSGTSAITRVELPHTCKELPLHYIDPEAYQMVCGYRRKLELPSEVQGKRIFLQFDGAAHIATVYVNGIKAGTHHCGYTAFRVEITNLVKYDGDNLVSVKLDTTENPEIPPFGFVIDYLTYGGLYREAWLDIRSQDIVEDIFVYTPTLHTANIKVTLQGNFGTGVTGDAAPVEDEVSRDEVARVVIHLLDNDGKTIWELEQDFATFKQAAQVTSNVFGTTIARTLVADISGAAIWDLDNPYLHACAVALIGHDGEIIDWQDVQFGVRTAEFKADGFYLNGQKTFLRGLNRHQCYPYIGYAAPSSLQWDDALILKNDLACTAVRTSHYPQSQHFLDACDHLGLLVFIEAPGWQHIGDAAWQDQAVENVREMVLQYRNHPSIVLWGVRINESLDNDAFYARTNAVAHELDPSRATSGVRYLEKSSLLEDVYAFNDFSHEGTNAGVRPKKQVTPDTNKALLISESNGHMYPTKPFDSWEHRQEQAVRHAHVMNDAYASGEHAGCFEWCMFDYPTHKDFGSGDRICYHGVMDAFRNPKIAAAVYASQGSDQWVLEVGSSMDIGDYPAGQIGDVYVFTNAEEVELYKNDAFVTKLAPSKFSALPATPLIVDDTIGELLESQEGFDKAEARILRECLLSARKHGLAGMPAADKLKMLYAMKRYGLTYDDGVALYGKYVGNWGGEATAWRFDAKVNGQVVKSVTCCPSPHIHLQAIASHTTLHEGDTYDMATVRVRIVDEHDNLAPYAQLPVRFEIEGCLQLVGPQIATAEGGSCGTYVRTTGEPGAATLTVSTEECEPITLTFEVK